MSSVKKGEGGDGGSSPGWKLMDTELHKEVKREDTPPLVTDLIKQEDMAYEPLETPLEDECEVVRRKFGDVGEGVPSGWRAAAVFHPSLMVGEALVNDLRRETCEEMKQEMRRVRSRIAREEVNMKEVGDQLVIAVEMDQDDGLPPGWEAAAVKDGGTKLPPDSVEIGGAEHKMEGETLKEDPLAVSSEGNNEDRPPMMEEAATAQDERSLVLPVSPELTVMEHLVEEVPPKENILAADMDDEDGAPPGWEAAPAAKDEGKNVPAELLSITRLEEAPLRVDQLATAGEGDNEVGPPPGWEAAVTKNAGDLLPLDSVEITPLEIKMEEARPTEIENNDDGPPPGWETATTKDGGVGEAVIKQESCKREKGEEKEEELPPPGWESVAAPRPPLPSKAQSPTTETGQLICGSCRSLLSYSKGAKYVQCLCCQTVSFVLEDHQVGQVYCGTCSVLLMYFYGSPAVRCSSCQFITQIGPHNKRPPLSEQEGTLQSQLAQLRPTTNVFR